MVSYTENGPFVLLKIVDIGHATGLTISSGTQQSIVYLHFYRYS